MLQTSMNVRREILVRMAEHASIPSDPTNAFVPRNSLVNSARMVSYYDKSAVWLLSILITQCQVKRKKKQNKQTHEQTEAERAETVESMKKI